MTPAVTHPLISAYLRDLELLLDGIERGERAEVLAGVHEHLDGALTPGASDEDIRRVLADLGSPQSVADEAYAGRPPRATAVASQPRPGALSRSWVPVVVGLLLGLALLVVVFMAAAGSGYSTSGSESMDAAGNVTRGPVEIRYDVGFPVTTLVVLLSSVLVWLPPLVLCLLSPLWTAREKVLAASVVPAAAIALTALPDIGWALTGTELGINVGAWVGLALALVGGGYALLRLCRTALRRAERLR